jgi:hypothetical protein
MAHSRYLRQMARSLRVEQQLTVDELTARLALPRSTIYYWVRDLPLQGLDRRHEPRTRASTRVDSHAAYEEALESFDELAAQPTFRDFVCVYLVQGEQGDRSRVALTNSDPAVIRLASRWIRRLTDRALSLSLQYRGDQSLGELRRFWSETVGADPRAIRARGSRSSQGSQHEPASSFPYGLLTVTVEDSLLRARLQGWMHRARESWR